MYLNFRGKRARVRAKKGVGEINHPLTGSFTKVTTVRAESVHS